MSKKFTMASFLETPAPVRESAHLRRLAAWYREFAERAGNPAIWDARLRTAEDLEAAADRVDAAARVSAVPVAAEGSISGSTQ
jgi:hypothetical protein